MMVYPEPFIVFRSIGVEGGERFGAGVIDKSGVSADYVERAHPGYVIVLLLRGRGSYIDAGGTVYPLEAGCVFQRFRGVAHTTRIDPESHWLECFIELGASMEQLLERCGGSFDRNCPVLRNWAFPALVERFVTLGAWLRNDSEHELAGRLPAILELAQLCLTPEIPSDRCGARQRMVETACTWLGRDFERHPDLKEFCRLHGWGYENFRKIFREATGLSPHRYRMRRRLDAACALLNRPDLSIAEIAERLGYCSPYEFSAQFKRHLGCPPSDYRPATGG